MNEHRPRKTVRERFFQFARGFAENLRTAERRRLENALDRTPITSEWVLLEAHGNDDMADKMHTGWDVVSHTPAYNAQMQDRYMMRKRRVVLASELEAGI